MYKFGSHKSLFASKADDAMGLVPNPNFMRIDTKPPKFFFNVHYKFSYINNGDILLNNDFLACFIGMGGPS